MGFRVKKVSANAAGTFNIYVIQPKWLQEIRLLPEGLKVRVETDLNRPGFRYSADGLPVKWNIRPDRLIIQSEVANENCGKVLGEVLKRLPWTPLISVGIEIEFQGDANESKEWQLPAFNVPEGYTTKQKTSHVVVEKDGRLYILQMSKAEKCEFSITVQIELSKNDSQEAASKIAQTFFSLFEDIRAEAYGLAKQLFFVELET